MANHRKIFLIYSLRLTCRMLHTCCSTRRLKTFLSSKFCMYCISIFCLLCVLQHQAVVYFQSDKFVNGSVYLLRGDVTIPRKASGSCPYFRHLNSKRELTKYCRTCSVVFNSGWLLGSEVLCHFNYI